MVGSKVEVGGRVKTLGRYKLVDRIGSGGMAEIWKAHFDGPVGFHKTVAVKRILPNLVSQQGQLDTFADEARLAAQLHHPNIVQVYDFGYETEAGNIDCYIAMEYVDGTSLRALMQARPGAGLPQDACLYVVMEAARGLAYAHAATDANGRPMRVVHRDVTPHNILVSKHGEVKIADFGIAKFAESMRKTAPGIIKGKLSYMSPEQARGEDLDHRTDVFSLGIVLYELLTGDRLFEAGSLAGIHRRLTSFQGLSSEELFGLPQKLRAVLTTALALDPADRYRSAEQMERELAQVLGGRAPEARSQLAELVSHFETPTPAARAPADAEPASLSKSFVSLESQPAAADRAPPAASNERSEEPEPTAVVNTRTMAEPPRRIGKPFLALVTLGTLAALAAVGFTWMAARRSDRDRPQPLPPARFQIEITDARTGEYLPDVSMRLCDRTVPVTDGVVSAEVAVGAQHVESGCLVEVLRDGVALEADVHRLWPRPGSTVTETLRVQPEPR